MAIYQRIACFVRCEQFACTCGVRRLCFLVRGVYSYPRVVLLGHYLKMLLSYFIGHVIIDSGVAGDHVSPRARSVRGVATSVLFMRNWSVS